MADQQDVVSADVRSPGHRGIRTPSPFDTAAHAVCYTPAMPPPALPSPADLSPLEIARIIDAALAEDLSAGDITTRSVVPPEARAEGVFSAREPIVLSGIAVAAAVFARLDPRVEISADLRDSQHVASRVAIARIAGPAHAVLAGERVALNLLQRMSGVATRTRAFVEALPTGSRARITDTRKTTPGLRALERYAVRCSGGFNHRNDLGSAVLIKDNHIVVCGGVRAAVERARGTHRTARASRSKSIGWSIWKKRSQSVPMSSCSTTSTTNRPRWPLRARHGCRRDRCSKSRVVSRSNESRSSLRSAWTFCPLARSRTGRARWTSASISPCTARGRPDLAFDPPAEHALGRPPAGAQSDYRVYQ